MRILKTPNAKTTPQMLWRELLRDPTAASATPDLIKAVNPHLNLTRDVPANSVLLIPEAADLKAGAATPVGAEELDALGADIDAGLRAVGARVSAGVKQLEVDHAAIASALKTAVAKRLVESDPQVKKQLEAADAVFKADQKRAKETQVQLADLQKLAAAEFAGLRKLIE